MNAEFSNLIKAARFPLVCLVVLVHSPLAAFPEVIWGDFSATNIYNFVTQCLSHNYGEMSVCVFFFFAGILFFNGMESFSWRWCLGKWRDRVHSLLIPFICWNLLMVAAIALKNSIFGLLGHYSAEEMEFVSPAHIHQWFLAPINYPLWFVKDLMVMVIVAPLLYYIVSILKNWSPVLLAIIYALPWEPTLVSTRAIFFFSMGAWCSLADFDVLRFCRKFRVPGHILAAATLLLATFTNASPIHGCTQKLFFPFGLISFLNIIDAVTAGRASVQAKLQSLSASVFFIYAAHEIYILGWTKGICLRLFGESLPAMYIRYFLVPVIVVAVCYGLFRLLQRVTPKALAFLCGGRLS